ncbi:hypothetical protein [Terrisporobacter mayombei]|uniref:Uncharacterized protein n=1 Tax=Terrisporobacter mayombei TaxID=1541 RepID=A0ABY9PW05_9FIRM|nr:hypothetical protein [Terrisporobacter mayombei]MCC3870253.1 hypothetical protein [Terrisporobacter mayombei]WMT79878.1 hypothetical protein TEMA_01490 [Terrisporobacter mayombei]
MYKCCRWCNNFSDGKCFSKSVLSNTEIEITKLDEEGLIYEALREAYTVDSCLKLESVYEYAKELKISQIKAKKLIEYIIEQIKDNEILWSLNDSICNTLENDIVPSAVIVSNEHEFVCSEFK